MHILCVLSALAFTFGNLLVIIYYSRERKRSHFAYDLFLDFDPDFIQTEWEFRRTQRTLFLAGGLITSFAWLCVSVPIIQMAWILSKQGRRMFRLHISLSLLVIWAALLEWISRAIWLGMGLATELLTSAFNLEEWVRKDIVNAVGLTNDNIGWKSLELIYINLSGHVWFVDSLEWLCWSGILFIIYTSVRSFSMEQSARAPTIEEIEQENTINNNNNNNATTLSSQQQRQQQQQQQQAEDTAVFSDVWNHLGLAIGFLCLLEFMAEILRFNGFRTFGIVALIYGSINRLLLMPTWLLWLGQSLPFILLQSKRTAIRTKAPTVLEMVTNKLDGKTADGENENTENNNNNNSETDGSTFMIGGDVLRYLGTRNVSPPSNVPPQAAFDRPPASAEM